MAYNLTLDDINAAHSNTAAQQSMSQQNPGYKLSLNDINEAAANKPKSNPSLLPRLGADTLTDFANIGHGIINAPHNIASYINPQFGAKIPAMQDYDYGKLLGVNNPNIYDKILQNAGKYGLLMANPETWPEAAAQIGFGITQNDNPLMGGAEALGGQLAGKAISVIPKIPGAVKSVVNYMAPQKTANQIMEGLSGGKTLEENAQSLASNIQNSYKAQKDAGKAIFKPVFDAVGNKPIYDAATLNKASAQKPTIYIPEEVQRQIAAEQQNLDTLSNSIVSGRGANALSTNTIGSTVFPVVSRQAKRFYDLDTKDLYKNFIKNPSLQNAHELQSQLGYGIRSLQKSDAIGNLSIADKNALQAYQRSRDALKSDIGNFLSKQTPELQSQYSEGSNNWFQNVAPYFSDSTLASIAKGKIKNPSYSQINSVFKNPEPEIQKVVGDMGVNANNKILYNELGKVNYKLTPENLTAYFNTLDNKGLSSYVTPGLQSQFNELGGKIALKNAAQIGAGAATGSFFGPLGMLIGGGLAASKHLPLMNILKERMLSGVLSKTAKGGQ